jgi:hypothetical protein
VNTVDYGNTQGMSAVDYGNPHYYDPRAAGHHTADVGPHQGWMGNQGPSWLGNHAADEQHIDSMGPHGAQNGLGGGYVAPSVEPPAKKQKTAAELEKAARQALLIPKGTVKSIIKARTEVAASAVKAHAHPDDPAWRQKGEQVMIATEALDAIVHAASVFAARLAACSHELAINPEGGRTRQISADHVGCMARLMRNEFGKF